MNIIKLAQEAELLKEDGTEPYRWGANEIEHFAELVAEAEREACAQVCEGHYDTAKAARAIRERGEK